MTIFEADWLCPVSSAPVRNGRLAVENGRIARDAAGDGHDRVGFPGCAIIPGFVNSHAHLELTILRGFLEDLPFATWIPRLTRAKYQQLTPDDMRVSTRLGRTKPRLAASASHRMRLTQCLRNSLRPLTSTV